MSLNGIEISRNGHMITGGYFLSMANVTCMGLAVHVSLSSRPIVSFVCLIYKICDVQLL